MPKEWVPYSRTCIGSNEHNKIKEVPVSNVLILAKIDDKGNEIFSGAFTSENELIDALKNEVTLKIQNGTPVALLKSSYVVKKMGLNTVAAPPITHPATRFVDVASETEWGKHYKVGVQGYFVASCSCPDFENRSKNNPNYVCKHMQRVTDRPSLYGV